MVIRSSIDNILIATNGTNGQPGTPGTSSYIHIKYSNDGGQTFTANDGETIGAYIGIYKDYTEADSSSVSDYQWKKIEGEDGAPAYTIILSNENFSISTDTSYIPIHTQNFTCNVTMLKGSSPADFSITASTDTENDIVTTVNGHTVTIAVASAEALSSPQGVITLTITTIEGQNTHTFTKDITWSVAVQGQDGQSGAAGVSITDVTNYYLATLADSGVTKQTTGWTTTIQNMTENDPYLWNYEVITGSNGQTISSTEPVIIGRYGRDGDAAAEGRGIYSIAEHYQTSSSNTTPPSTWSDTPVATDNTNKYLWNYETITYTDNTSEDTQKRVIGTHGTPGGKGDTGRGIASITEYFLLSDTDDASKITFPEVSDKHGWTTVGEALIWSKNKPYLWHCTEVVYENPSSTVYIDKYCDTSWKAADLVQSNLTDFQQGVDQIVDRDNQSIRSAVWENTYTYKPKKDAQGNYIYDEHGKIVPDTDNTTSMAQYMAETIYDMDGITSRVSSSESSIDSLGSRVSTAESTITQHATDIEAKVSKDGVIAAINLSTETEGGSTAKISADKVEINGTAIFNSISSDVNSAIESKGYATTAQSQGYANTAQQNAINEIPTDISELNNDAGYQTASDVSGAIVSTTTLYYASNSTTPPAKPTAHVTTNSTSTRGEWNLSLPSYNANYPYLYICSEVQTKGGSYLWTSVEQTAYASAISSIKTTADAASPKTSAIARSQRIYYRKTTSGAPAKNTTWLASSGTGYGNWSLNIPQLTDSNGTKYLYLYTAVQTQTVAQQAAGTACTCSDVLIDDTATIIDGGTIITGTVTAREITTDNLQGDHGWINLKDGKFYYGDESTFAASDNAISWNGSKLQIKADEFLLASGKSIFDEIEAIETWFYATAPTTSNAPASSWTTDNLKEMHLRDIYFDTNSGKSYRWAKEGTTYKWVEIEDKELSALAGRVATAETNISTNSEQIALRATKTEVANTYATKESVPTNVTDLDDADNYATKDYADDAADTAEANAKADTTTKLQSYYTKTETDSAISQTAEGITTRVTKLETRSAGNYATSSTGAGTTAKVATIVPAVTGWELYKGAVMTVKFTAANTASAPTLNINSTGAKPIKTYSGGNLSEAEYKWDAGTTMSFVYDGTNWRIQDSTELVRIKNAESSITQTATSIESIVSANDTYTKPDGTTATNTLKSLISQNTTAIEAKVDNNGVIAAINLSTETEGGSTAKIHADKVNIDGATIFTDGRLSQTSLDNAYDAKGAASAAETASKTYADGKASAAESSAKTYADEAVESIANGANAQEQLIYISKATGTTSVSANTTWVTDATGNQNVWTTKRPEYSKSYPVLFVATQRQTVSQSNGNTCTCTTPMIDNTTTIIDGGNIITGTVTANQLNVADINASKSLTVGAFQESVQDDILNSNIQVGGRNLLRKNDITAYADNQQQSLDVDSYISEGKIIYSRGAVANLGFYLTNYDCFEPNTNYIIHFDVVQNATDTESGNVSVAYFLSQNPNNISSSVLYIDGVSTGKGVNTDISCDLSDKKYHHFCLQFQTTSTITTDGTYAGIICQFNKNVSTAFSVTFSNLKFEKGNKETGWTPAPEDMTLQISDVQGQINSTQNDISNLQTDMDDKISASEESIMQTIEEYDQTQQENINAVQGNVDNLEGRVGANEENINGLKDFQTDVQGWMHFDTDTAELSIGRTDSVFTTVIDNDSIDFKQDGVAVAYVSANTLFITDAEIKNNLAIGKFLYKPHDNNDGGMSLIWNE